MMFKTNTYEDNLFYGKTNNFNFLVKFAGLEYEQSFWEDEFIIFNFKDTLKRFL